MYKIGTMKRSFVQNDSFIKKVLFIFILLGSSLAAAEAQHNFKRKGKHAIPELHGSLVLTECMVGLLGKDIPPELKKECGSVQDTVHGIIFLYHDNEYVQVIVGSENVPELNEFSLGLSDVHLWLSTLKKSIENQIESEQSERHETFVPRWVCEPTFNQESQIFLCAIEYAKNDTKYIRFQAMALDYHIEVFFVSDVPEKSYTNFKNSIEALVNSFRFDGNAAHHFSVANSLSVNDETFKLLSGLLLLLFLFILAIVCLFVWRRRVRTGNKKLVVELLLSFVLTIINSVILIFWFDKWPFHFGLHIGSYILFYCSRYASLPCTYLISTLAIFFIFFFWTWTQEHVAVQPARSIIRVMCVVICLAAGFSLVRAPVDFFRVHVIDLSSFVISIILLILVVWKYRRLMNPQ